MADLNALMQKHFGNEGQETETNTQPTSNLDALVQKHFGSQDNGEASTAPTGTFGQMLPQLSGQEEQVKSPASNWSRLEMSTLTIPQREAYLKNRFSNVEMMENGKFLVGDSPDNLIPVDPDNGFNDVIGDIADVVGEIPVIAGQILGTVGGAAIEIPSGPVPTTLLGAGAGSALGAGVKKLVGSKIAERENIKQQEAISMATDIAIEGTLGLAGEGISQLLGKAGKRFALKKAGNLLQKSLQKSGDPKKGLGVLSKILNVTAKIDPTDTVNAGMYNFDKVFTKKYLNPDYLTDDIMPRFIKEVVNKTDELGRMVGTGKKWAINNFGKDSIDMVPKSSELINFLKQPNIGILDEIGRLNKGAFVESSDFKTFKQLTDLFFTKNPKTGQVLPRNLKISELINFKERMNPALKSYFNSTRANKSVKRAFAIYFDDVDNLINDKIIQKVGSKGLGKDNVFSASKRAFTDWKTKLELLKTEGLDVSDMTNLKKVLKASDDVTISSKVERFVEGLRNKTQSSQRAFKLVADQLEKIPGGGIQGEVGTLYDEVVKYTAAQGFTKSNIDLLRFGALTSIISMATGTDFLSGEVPGPVQLGASVLIGTPVGNRFLLKQGSKLSNQLIKKGIREVGRGAKQIKQTAKSPATTALLSRLIKAEAVKNSNNNMK